MLIADAYEIRSNGLLKGSGGLPLKTFKKYDNVRNVPNIFLIACVVKDMVSLSQMYSCSVTFWNAVVSSKWLSRELGLKLRIIKRHSH